MEKTLCNRISYVLLIIIMCLIFLPGDVFAKDSTSYDKDKASKACKNFINKVEKDGSFWQKRYQVVSNIGDNLNYNIDIDSSNLDSQIKKYKDDIKFKVVKIVSYDNNKKVKTTLTKEADIENKIIGSNKRLTSSNGLSIKNMGDGSAYVEVYVEPDGFTDAEFKKACGDKTQFTMVFNFEHFGSIIGQQFENGYTKPEIASSNSTTSRLDCSNYRSWDSNSFNYKYCEALTQATEANPNDTPKYRCFTDIDANTYKNADGDNLRQTPSPDNPDTYYIKQNRRYLRHSEEIEIPSGTYTYRYTGGTETESVSCKLTCEEVVTVEYGPPVAVIGGLCFEYNVRVTSRVSCWVSETPKPPRSYSGYCTPYPVCSGAYGVFNQGGPNEDFDACVKSCDGGSYTDKCSNKCYKKVYGKSLKKQGSTLAVNYANKLNNNSLQDTKIKKVSNEHTYVVEGGSISWITGSGYYRGAYYTSNAPNDSRWHLNNWWGLSGYPYACYSGNGIVRDCGCSDYCTWTLGSCSSLYGVYMNPGVGDEDERNNYAKYNEMVNQCSRAATCSTKTAEFTISADVEGDKTYYFPYNNNSSSSKDLLCSNSNGSACSNTRGNSNSTLVKRGINGCYDQKTSPHWYQSEWTFPGSWINYKNGELSYSSKTGNNAWQEMENRFCLPFTVKPVNEKWWQYYYGKVVNPSKIESISSTEFNKLCLKSNENNKLTKSTKVNQSDIKWNIKASARNFGYFGWNIDFECFYAFSDNATRRNKSSMNQEEKDNCIVGKDNYQIRSVDLENLFPDPTGTKKITSATDRGRTPGFNWSGYATNGSTKVGEYKSNPNDYASRVQELGYNVYSDKYLDYEINLTRSEIRNIKDSNHKYGNYDNGNVNVGAVATYKSNLIRSTLKDAKYPNDKTLACNNIAAHNNIGKGYSADCEG